MPKPNKNDQLWKDKQVAERLGVSATTVRRLRYAGTLPTVRVGPHRTSPARVPLSAVLAYEAAQTEGGAA